MRGLPTGGPPSVGTQPTQTERINMTIAEVLLYAVAIALLVSALYYKEGR